MQICKPIMARQFIEGFQKTPEGKSQGPEFRKGLLGQLGKEIVLRMTHGTVIMSTALVSSVLLMYRKGISEDELVRFVN